MEIPLHDYDGNLIMVDEGVVAAVSLLWVAGIKTTGCCEGHNSWGLPTPWIDIAEESVAKLPKIWAPLVLINYASWTRLTVINNDKMDSIKILRDFAESLLEENE